MVAFEHRFDYSKSITIFEIRPRISPDKNQLECNKLVFKGI